jgi:uncharacterized protein YrzB (UPF0473 family)
MTSFFIVTDTVRKRPSIVYALGVLAERLGGTAAAALVDDDGREADIAITLGANDALKVLKETETTKVVIVSLEHYEREAPMIEAFASRFPERIRVAHPVPIKDEEQDVVEVLKNLYETIQKEVAV